MCELSSITVALRTPMTLTEFLAWEERQECASNSTGSNPSR